MAISYNFHISRPNKIYLNWIEISSPLASNLGPSWEGSMPVAERHIEMPLTKCSAVFFWGGILFFQRQRSTVSKKPLRCLVFSEKSGLCTIFFGVICDHLSPSSPSSLVWWGYAIVGLSTALVLELVSLHFSHWEFIDFHAIGGSAWWVVWKQNQDYFFCFRKGQFTNESKKKVRIFLGIHLERHFICHMLNSFVIFIVTNILIYRGGYTKQKAIDGCVSIENLYRRSSWNMKKHICRLDQNQYEIDPKMIAKNLWIFQDGCIFEQNQELPLENTVN